MKIIVIFNCDFLAKVRQCRKDEKCRIIHRIAEQLTHCLIFVKLRPCRKKLRNGKISHTEISKFVYFMNKICVSLHFVKPQRQWHITRWFLAVDKRGTSVQYHLRGRVGTSHAMHEPDKVNNDESQQHHGPAHSGASTTLRRRLLPFVGALYGRLLELVVPVVARQRDVVAPGNPGRFGVCVGQV